MNNQKNQKNQVTLLQLAAAQLAMSLKETEQPFDDLSKLFIEIVEGYNSMEGMIGSTDPSAVLALKDINQLTQRKVREAIIDFQFYDRMTQRLQHIMSNIQDAIKVIENGDEEEWTNIFEGIEKSYTMRQETDLFNSIRSGVGFEDAIKSLVEQTYNRDTKPDIELF